MKFDKIIVVGSSRLLAHCASECKKYLPTEVIENAHVPENKAVHRALSDIPLHKLSKTDTMDYIDKLDGRILVFSVINTYLFPREIVNKSNVTIVNFHPALLPKYPGRNSEAWAIYEGENETGITWHYIDENVDNGYIILQRKTSIEETDTAISLFTKLVEIGAESFSEVISRILNDTVVKIPLNTNPKDIKLSKDIPNNGYFDPNWDFDKASCFLRSMDFGFRPQFAEPKIIINNSLYTWKKYALNNNLNSACGIELQNNNIVINYKNGTIILKKISSFDNGGEIMEKSWQQYRETPCRL